MAAVIVAGSVSTAKAGPQLLTNGNFLQGGAGWTGYQTSAPVNPAPYAADGIEVLPNGNYGLPSYHGYTTNLEVNANHVDAVYQVVTGLVVGQYYDLSFGYSGRYSDGSGSALDVFFGAYNASSGAAVLDAALSASTPIIVDTFNGNANTVGWVPNDILVRATATTETLAFRSVYEGGPASYGNELSDVSLIDEPASNALLLSGVTLLVGMASTRRTATRRQRVARSVAA